MNKVKKNKRKLPNHLVAIEIQRSQVALIVAERQQENLTNISGHHMTWLQDATSLQTEDGVRELTAALRTLAGKAKAVGAGANVSLSSELCVTRVLAGETEALQNEIRDLHERSSQYLSLGVGEKAVAQSSRAIDAKHSQTWLTVANKQTLDNLLKAVEQAGLHVDLIEHSLVAICRVIGQSGRDAASPVIIIDINERGVDLGVSYRGQLLFDYRPGGLDSKCQIGEIINRHLERIQRYCNRQFRNVSGTISDAFICGLPDELDEVRQQFQGTSLNAEVLDPSGLCPAWGFDDGFTPDAHFVAPIGSLLIEEAQLEQPPEERGLPDLMDAYRSAWREPLAPALIKVGWPIAAALLLALGIYGAAHMEGNNAANLEAQAELRNTDAMSVSRMQSEVDMTTKRIKYLTTIKASVSNPAYHQLVAAIGQSIPMGVWLKQIDIDERGIVTIKGPAESSDAMFEFVADLKKVAQLTDVSLLSQDNARSQTGEGQLVVFNIQCRYVGSNDLIERTASND